MYFVRVYAVRRGDAGKYRLTAEFKEAKVGPWRASMTTPLAKAALIERRGELFDATAGKRHYQDLEAYGERVASRAHRTRG